MSDDTNMSDTCNMKPATNYISTSLHDAVKLRIGKQGLAAIKPVTIPQFIRECCQKFSGLKALSYEKPLTIVNGNPNGNANGNPNGNANGKTNGDLKMSNEQTETINITYSEYLENIRHAGAILLHVGLQSRSSLGILALNCPEWFYFQLGSLFAGGVIAGIYPSSSSEAVRHALDNSEATVCVVDDAEQMKKVRSIKNRLPRLRAIIQLHGPYEDYVGHDEGLYRWSDLKNLKLDDELYKELDRREKNVGANECGTLIYTSGTTGMPKAVMLSHDSVVYDAKAISSLLSSDLAPGSERVVTYLPLNHIAAQIMDIYLSIENGACVYFADRGALKGTLIKTLKKAKPTRFFAVPRIFEKLEEQLGAKEAKASGFTRFLLRKARNAMLQYHLDRMAGRSSSTLKYWLASKIINPIKLALGFDETKTLLIGGAPTSEDVKKFFLSLDLPLIEVFGLSETGAVNINIDMRSFETVGRPFEGVEQKINNPDSQGHGEICIRSRSNLMGYLHELEKTKETISEDGWLLSGDIGYLNTDGDLVVSGRLKELVITAGGENIPPVRIEELIKHELKGISNVTLIGDHKKYLTVLMTIKTEMDPVTGMPKDSLGQEALEWMQDLELPFTKLSEVLNIPEDITSLDASNIDVNPHIAIIASIEEGIKRANTHALSNAQKVQKFRLLPHDYSLPTGELGDTLKIRRMIVLQKYANIIEQMY